MQSTAPSGRVTSAAERAQLRDRLARLRNGLPERDEPPHEPPPAGDLVDELTAKASRARAKHGDVGPDGDLVNELRPSRIMSGRERRLAANITAATPELAARHLENLMRALEGVPA